MNRGEEMRETNFVLGFQFGSNYESFLDEKDSNEVKKLKKELKNTLKKEYPNIVIDFNWTNPNDIEVIGYAFEILNVEGDSHQKALTLKNNVYQKVWGSVYLRDFYLLLE